MTAGSHRGHAELQPQLIRSGEAARFLAISERTLWSLTRSGRVPHVRVGRCLRYDVDDLRQWIEQKKKQDGRNA
jgi:excisionase family DNA binding protein